MVKKMNKKEFIDRLVKETNKDINECIIICDCLENHFFIGKNNKEKIVLELMEKLNLNSEEANEIYEISSNIFVSEIKDKIRHPFKSKD